MQIKKQRKCLLSEPEGIEWDVEIVAFIAPCWCFFIVELRAVAVCSGFFVLLPFLPYKTLPPVSPGCVSVINTYKNLDTVKIYQNSFKEK